MVTVALKKIGHQIGLEHNKTTFYLGTGVEDNTVIDVIHTETKTDDVRTLVLDMVMPPGVVYYCQALLFFKDTETTYLTKPVAIKNINKDLDNMLLKDDTVIEEPLVIIDSNPILDGSATITIKTSEFKSNNDTHKASHYIIRSGKDILYCNLYDEDNKTSITIPNEYEYRNKNSIEILTAHVGSSGVESPFSIKKFSIPSTYNFDIITNISSVPPLEDLLIQFKRIDPTYDYNIIKIELIDYNTDSILLSTTLTEQGNITIPWYLLKEDLLYMLEIYCYDNENQYKKVVKTLKVTSFTNIILRDTSYKYGNRLTHSDSAIIKVPANYHIESMMNGYVLVPELNGKRLIIHKYINEFLTNTREVAYGIHLLNNYNPYTLIKPISKTLVLVDTYNHKHKPTFLLFKYIPNLNIFELVSETERDDEVYPLGINNAILAISSTDLIYMPYGTSKLRNFNIESGEVSELPPCPMDTFHKGILVRAGNNQIYLLNSESYMACSYNYFNKKYTTGLQFGPTSFLNTNLRAIPLINGDTLVIRLHTDIIKPPTLEEEEKEQEVVPPVTEEQETESPSEDEEGEKIETILENTDGETITPKQENGKDVTAGNIDEEVEHNNYGDTVVEEVDPDLDTVDKHDISVQRFSYSTRKFERYLLKYTNNYPTTSILSANGTVNLYSTNKVGSVDITQIHTYK